MITIPFAAKIGTKAGAALDGVIYGNLPKVAASSAVSESHLAPITKVFRGNADASGSINWSDITTVANNDTAGDVSLFDAINPTADMLCVELSPGDEIGGVSLLISLAAVLVGAPAAEVRYRTAAGWAFAAGVVTPSLTSTGLKAVTFTVIKYSDITPTDSVLDPFNAAQQRPVKGGSGIPSPEAKTYTSLTVACRETSLADETVSIGNATTGKVVTAKVLANTAIAKSAVSLAVGAGDELILTHVAGSSALAIGDGVVFLS